MASDVYAQCMAEPSSSTRSLMSRSFLYIFGRLGDKGIHVAVVTWHRARESSSATKTSTEIKYIYSTLYISWLSIPHQTESLQPCRNSNQKQPSFGSNLLYVTGNFGRDSGSRVLPAQR